MASRLQTYVVKDKLTIRENLISTLEERSNRTVLDHGETQHVARETDVQLDFWRAPWADCL